MRALSWNARVLVLCLMACGDSPGGQEPQALVGRDGAVEFDGGGDTVTDSATPPVDTAVESGDSADASVAHRPSREPCTPATSRDGCDDDGDCPSGTLCECRESTGSEMHECLPGNCAVDADCGAGGLCSPSNVHFGISRRVDGYYCRTADDECTTDIECGRSGRMLVCAYDTVAERWRCLNAVLIEE